MPSPTFTNKPVCRYRVKVIHPKCKKNYNWLNLNDVSRKFTTVLELKQQLISSLGEHVPAHLEISTFSVAYLKKPAQSRQWLITERDLETMYAQSGEEISIWCDHRCKDSSTPST